MPSILRHFIGSWKYLCVLLIVVGVFFGGGEVFAQFGQQGAILNSDGSISPEWITNADAILKTLYLFMRPLLAIAGAALDNSLVYGEPFYLNITLFKIWQMMSTFANFIVGFIFLVSIFGAYFNPESAGQKIKDVIIKSFIATIAIWSSRFVVGALVDFSTLGVVTLGALPLNVMGEAETIKDVRFLMTHSYYDKTSTTQEGRNKSPFETIYSCAGDGSGTQYFLPCNMQDYTSVRFGGADIGSGDIIGFVPKDRVFVGTAGELEYTHSQPKDIDEALARRGNPNSPATSTVGVNAGNLNADYCVQQGVLMRYSQEDVGLQPAECQRWMESKAAGITAMSEEFGCSRFSDITSKAANTSGPLFTLYGSIFALSNLPATTNVGNTGEAAIEMLMKIIVGAGMLVPLAAFAVVMVIRVVVLWLVIAFAPLLALAYAFDFKQITELGDGKFALKNILNLLMMPVIGVFAISLSIIFLSVLNNVDYIQDKNDIAPTQVSGECHDDQATAVGGNSFERVKTPDGIDQNTTKCYEFLGIQTLCINESLSRLSGNASNTFVRLITNGLGIALMRMAVMFVLKTNKFTEGAVDFIDKTAQSVMKSAKIIPVPRIPGGMSVGGAQKAAQNLKRTIPNKMIESQYNEGMSDWVDRMDGDEGGKSQALQAAAQGASTAAASGNGSVIKDNVASSGHTMDTYGAKFVSDAGKSIGKDIQADLKNNKDSTYRGIDTSALATLTAGGVSSYAQLAKNKAFITHATQNGYLNDFATKRHNTKDPSMKQKGGAEFLSGMEEVSNVSRSYKENGKKHSYFFHDGKVTYIMSDANSSIIEKVSESKPFALNGTSLPGESIPANEDQAKDFLRFFNENGQEAGMMKIFGDAESYPYQDLINLVANADELVAESGTQTIQLEVPGRDKPYVTFEVQLGTKNDGGKNSIDKLTISTSSEQKSPPLSDGG